MDSRSTTGPESAPGGAATEATIAEGQGPIPDDPGRATEAEAGGRGAPGPGVSGAGVETIAASGLDAANLGGPASPAASDRAAPVVPGYEILGELGRGAMGVVYEARQIHLNRRVALKMILAGEHAGHEAALRFLAEAEAVARLDHPNVVRIFHLGAHGGYPYFEMEYVGGGSLADRLDGTPRPPGEAAGLVETLAGAMAEAHRLGIVHRDLKPANVLMTPEGVPKVADFGLAKFLNVESGLTRTDSVMGSPSYMAPEQAEGKTGEVGPAADVYALGAVFYELLTGRPPFRGVTVLDTLRQVKTTEPVSPSRLVPGLSRDVETVALTCLQKEPAKRYRSAGALAEDLRRYRAGEPIAARPVGPGERLVRWGRRNPAVAALEGLAATLLVLVAAVALLAYARTSEALAKEREARKGAVGSLYHALVGEARALRTAREVGYRGHVFGLLGRAARLDTSERDASAMRHEAVACLGDFVGLEPLVLRYGIGLPVTAIHPRSESIAVGYGEGTVDLFDRLNLKFRARLAGPKSYVSALTFTADGRRLLIGHDDGTVRVADDPASGPPRIAEMPKAEGRVFSFVATPAGRSLVVSKPDGNKAPQVRDIEAPKTEAVSLDFLEGRSVESFRSRGVLAISPDGLLAAGRDRSDRIILYDIPSRRVLRQASVPRQTGSIAFSPDRTRLAFGYDGGFTLLAVDDFSPRLTARLDSATSLRFSPDSQTIAVGTQSGVVHLWNLPTNRIMAELTTAGGSSNYEVAFSEDGRTLAATSGGSLHLWDLAGASERLALAGHGGGVTGVAFSPDGATLASVSKEGTAKLWDPVSGRLIRSLGGYSGDVQACAFTRDGSLLITGAQANDRLRFWDTRRWKEAHRTTTAEVPLNFLVAGPVDDTGHALLIASHYGVWIGRVRKSQAGEITLEPTASWSVPSLCLALSPDGAKAAVADYTTVRVYDGKDGRALPFSGPKVINGWHAVAFRSDRELVYVARDGAAVVWDVAADRPVKTIGKPGTFKSFHVAVSPGGRWLAAEVTPSSVGIVDLERGELLYSFRGELSPIWSMAWSPDARRLAVGLSDGGLVVWDMNRVRKAIAAAGLEHIK